MLIRVIFCHGEGREGDIATSEREQHHEWNNDNVPREGSWRSKLKSVTAESMHDAVPLGGMDIWRLHWVGGRGVPQKQM